jgi:hypothetical protein
MRACLCILLLCITLAANCLAPGGGGPAPTPGTTHSMAGLKYLLLDYYGEDHFFFCDPDYYPVARDNEQERATETFPAIVNETGVLSAITARKDLHPPFSDEDKLVIYREFKKLNAISLGPAGNGTYSFSLQLGTRGEGRRVSGMIRSDGVILNGQSENVVLTCPICLAGGTLIDTLAGPVPVEDIREGMIVWSPRRDGAMEAAPVLRTGKTRVPPGHQLVRIRLSDGRELSASPGHPTLDGRKLGSLMAGGRLDGATVTGADLVPNAGEFTYDILPAGETGGYRANGILLASTLAGVP